MKVGILGAGTMGAGIVQVLAQHGIHVVMRDLQMTMLDKGYKGIEKNLQKMVDKGKLTAEGKLSAMALIEKTTELEALMGCDVIIEAATENMALKKQIFQELDEKMPQHTILATNTSSLSITEIASATMRPDRVIGMHFFNPVPVMKLVEIIKGIATSQETFDVIYSLSSQLGKEPVKVEEAPGFVVNRILIPMINEAVAIYAEGVASAEDIDKAMMLGANHPIGPLALADLIGNDVNLAIMEVLHKEFGDSKYRPHPMLRKMVRAGLLGRKSGKGFYQY